MASGSGRGFTAGRALGEALPPPGAATAAGATALAEVRSTRGVAANADSSLAILACWNTSPATAATLIRAITATYRFMTVLHVSVSLSLTLPQACRQRKRQTAAAGNRHLSAIAILTPAQAIQYGDGQGALLP
jgi:hypothetical protein